MSTTSAGKAAIETGESPGRRALRRFAQHKLAPFPESTEGLRVGLTFSRRSGTVMATSPRVRKHGLGRRRQRAVAG
jgi:hypothetical protein